MWGLCELSVLGGKISGSEFARAKCAKAAKENKFKARKKPRGPKQIQISKNSNFQINSIQIGVLNFFQFWV
jgi:hypothetical protein